MTPLFLGHVIETSDIILFGLGPFYSTEQTGTAPHVPSVVCIIKNKIVCVS